MKVKSLSHARLVATHGWQPTRLLHPWDFPGKSTGVECHCLLQKFGVKQCKSLTRKCDLYDQEPKVLIFSLPPPGLVTLGWTSEHEVSPFSHVQNEGLEMNYVLPGQL